MGQGQPSGAANLSQDVAVVSTLLRSLGYALPENANNALTPDFTQAFKSAVSHIKTALNVQGASLGDTQQQLAAQVSKWTNSPELRMLESLPSFMKSNTLLEEQLKNKGVPEQFRKHPEALINFLKQYNSYIPSILGVEAALNGTKRPVQLAHAVPAYAPGQITAAEQVAAKTVTAQQIKAFQAAIGVSPASGQWDTKTKSTYQNFAQVVGQHLKIVQQGTPGFDPLISGIVSALGSLPDGNPQKMKLKSVMETIQPLAPVLKSAHHSFALAEAKAGPNGGAVEQVMMLEAFLSDPALHQKINAIAQKIDPNFKLASPENAQDGQMDKGAQTALQQVLTFLVSPMGLNLPHHAPKPDPSNPQAPVPLVAYSPVLGHDIAKALKTPATPAAKAFAEHLKTSGIEDPQMMVLLLDSLNQNSVLTKGAIHAPAIPSFGPLQLGIIGFVVELVADMWPDAIPQLDAIARQYMGAGLLDVVPELGVSEPLRNALKHNATLPPEERLMETFKQTFANARTPEERLNAKRVLIEGVRNMSSLGVGSAERRKNYPAEVEAAMEVALQSMGSIQPGDQNYEWELNEASKIFASQFMRNEYALERRAGGIVHQPLLSTETKSTLLAELQALDPPFDLRGNGAPTSASDLQAVVQAYIRLNGDTMDYAHEPLIFNDQNGQTYIAGIDRSTNIFTIESFPVADMRHAQHAQGLAEDKLMEMYPGYALARQNYSHYFNKVVQYGVKLNESIFHTMEHTTIESFQAIDTRSRQAEANARDYQTYMGNAEQVRQDLKNARQNQHYLSAPFNRITQARKGLDADHLGGDHSVRYDVKSLMSRPQVEQERGMALITVYNQAGPVNGRRVLTLNLQDEIDLWHQTPTHIRNQMSIKDMGEIFPKLMASKDQYPRLFQGVSDHHQIEELVSYVAREKGGQRWTREMTAGSEHAGTSAETHKPALNGKTYHSALAAHVKTSPYVVVSDDGRKIELVGPDARGHDIRDELKRYRQTNNPQDLSALSAVADKYPNLTAVQLAGHLMEQERVVNALGDLSVSPAPPSSSL